MPSRWMSLAILVFWLATTAWLVYHDLWPEWRPGEPPPFHIDLVEEVQKGPRLKTNWDVLRQGEGDTSLQRIFRATTWVDYDADNDIFALNAEFNAIDTKHPYSLAKLHVQFMSSQYRVTRPASCKQWT